MGMNDYYKAPIVDEGSEYSFKRGYNFKWSLKKDSNLYSWISSVNNFIGNDTINKISDLIYSIKNNKNTGVNLGAALRDALASGDMTAAYTLFSANIFTFADKVSERAKKVTLPDDTIEMEMYDYGNTQVPVPNAKSIGDITVTYIEDQYNNVYNFHKVWQECLRPGGTFCFMDVASFSICGEYITTDNHLSDKQFKEVYNDYDATLGSKVKEYSKTIYPLIFPKIIKRGDMDATSKEFKDVTVTYVRTPIVTKSKNLVEISFEGKNNFNTFVDL